MQTLLVVVLVAVGGAIGGIVNALMTDNGFVLSKREEGVWRPGFLGNVIIGMVAAFVLWGLYGPLATGVIIGTGGAAATLSFADFAGAIVTGTGGSRILTAELDKKVLRQAAAAAREQKTDPADRVRQDIQAAAGASPFEVLRAMRGA